LGKKSNFDLRKTQKPKFSQKVDPEKPKNPGLANPGCKSTINYGFINDYA